MKQLQHSSLARPYFVPYFAPVSRQTTTPSLLSPISTWRSTVGEGRSVFRSKVLWSPVTKYPTQLVVTADGLDWLGVCWARTPMMHIATNDNSAMVDPIIILTDFILMPPFWWSSVDFCSVLLNMRVTCRTRCFAQSSLPNGSRFIFLLHQVNRIEIPLESLIHRASNTS